IREGVVEVRLDIVSYPSRSKATSSHTASDVGW
ncbi:MAG: hypothetical protein ABEK84_08080, partial [Salinibacter sp.]